MGNRGSKDPRHNQVQEKVLVEQLETHERCPYEFERWQGKNPGQSRAGPEGPSMSVSVGCTGNVCHGAMMSKAGQLEVSPHMDSDPATVLTQARDFFSQYFEGEVAKVETRMLTVLKEVKASGTYRHDPDELQFGARRAWRNAGRCVYRQVAETLTLRDCRHITDTDQAFQQICQHARQVWGTGSDIVPLITVFPPKLPGYPIDMEFISEQLWRFAAYDDGQGGIVGDPSNLELTKYCVKLGWEPPPLKERSEFDLLPVCLKTRKGGAKLYTLPADVAGMMVEIMHPEFQQEFQTLGLRWCGLPMLNTMTLWVGGVAYPCAPFTGWFMVTEVGRNFADKQRYNKLEAVAQALNLDAGDAFSIDTAWTELNKAIFHSWSKIGVPMVNHRAASEGFCHWYKKELQKSGACPADWVWVVPPLGGSTLPVWHQEMLNYQQFPMYLKNPDPVAAVDLSKIQVSAQPRTPKLVKSLLGLPVLIFVGSQSGNTELRALDLARRLKNLGAEVNMTNMDDALAFDGFAEDYFDEAHPGIFPTASESADDVEEAKRFHALLEEAAKGSTVALFLTSTFGSGAPPQSASAFIPAAELVGQLVSKQPGAMMEGLRYAVCGFGSSSYPHFNRAGRTLQTALEAAAGPPMVSAGECDDQANAQVHFLEWTIGLLDVLGVPKDGLQLQAIQEPPPEWQWVGKMDMLCHRTDEPQGPRMSVSSRSNFNAPGRIGSMPRVPGNRIGAQPSITSAKPDLMQGQASVKSAKNRKSIKSVTFSMPVKALSISHLTSQHMEVVENSELIAPGAASQGRSMRHLVLKSEAGAFFRAGDVIEVLPENSREDIENFATAIGLPCSFLQLSFQLQYAEGREGRYSEPQQLHGTLARELDLRAPPTPELLRHLAAAIRRERPEDPRLLQLQELQQGLAAYKQWVELGRPTVPSLLSAFDVRLDYPMPKRASIAEGSMKTQAADTVPLSLAALIASLPAIRPRLYSISNGSFSLGTDTLSMDVPGTSSSAGFATWCSKYIDLPSHLHLCVSVAQLQGSSEAGPGACAELRSGFSSRFISQIEEGDILRARVLAQPMSRLPSPERLGELGSRAALLIGMGSGIAPLRAVLHELMVYRATYGIEVKVTMIHGCRTEEERVHLEEFKGLVDLGFLELLPALSRAPEGSSAKGHVQDKIRQHRVKILELLMEQHALVYVCGLTAAVQGIRSTLLEAVLGEAGNMDSGVASSTLERLVQEGKFHEEAFGA